jgi:hypothetical protein
MTAAKDPDRFTIAKKPCTWTDKLGRVVPGEHGTTTQYARALRVGATPCAACRKANLEKDLAWRRANAGKKPSANKARTADHVAKQKERAAERKPGPQSKGSTRARKIA